MGFLDHAGLTYLWGKVKAALGLKMDASVYDPTGKAEDVFGYADTAVSALPIKKLVGTVEHPIDLDTLTEAGRYYIEGELVDKVDLEWESIRFSVLCGVPVDVLSFPYGISQNISTDFESFQREKEDEFPWSEFSLFTSAAESKSLTAILLAAAWTGTAAPYSQTVSVANLASGTNGSIGLSQSATAEQRAAAREAMLCVTGQASGSLTVTADGVKPTVDIPVTITILG